MTLLSLFDFWCFICGVSGAIGFILVILVLIAETYEKYDDKAKWDAEWAAMQYENEQWEKKYYSKRQVKKCETK